MKRMFVALIVLTMAGCASVSGLREKGPRFSASSNHSVADVVTCISTGWQSHRVTARILPINGGQSLQADNAAVAGSPFAVADVTATENGSQIRYYQQGIAVDSFLNETKHCQ